MGRTPSSHRARRTSIALALCASLTAAAATSGCALLIPPSWRGQAPIPLAGPIDPAELDGPGTSPADDPANLSDDQLRALVEADQARLIEIAGDPDSGPLTTPEAEAELRTIANRLPRMQRELESRGTGAAGSRIRHPVIR